MARKTAKRGRRTFADSALGPAPPRVDKRPVLVNGLITHKTTPVTVGGRDTGGRFKR